MLTIQFPECPSSSTLDNRILRPGCTMSQPCRNFPVHQSSSQPAIALPSEDQHCEFELFEKWWGTLSRAGSVVLVLQLFECFSCNSLIVWKNMFVFVEGTMSKESPFSSIPKVLDSIQHMIRGMSHSVEPTTRTALSWREPWSEKFQRGMAVGKESWKAYNPTRIFFGLCSTSEEDQIRSCVVTTVTASSGCQQDQPLAHWTMQSPYTLYLVHVKATARPWGKTSIIYMSFLFEFLGCMSSK